MEKLDRKLEKLKIDINGYHDIVSDLRGVWADLKGILDYGDEREKDILDGVLGIVDEFEEYIEQDHIAMEKAKETK